VPKKPKQQPQPKAARPNLAELDYEDEEPSGLGIIDDDGNMVLRRDAAKRRPKATARRKKHGG
jgi:hypothetical protein